MFYLKLAGLLTFAFANRRRGGVNKAIAPQLLHYADIFQGSSFLLLLLLSINSMKQERTFGP